MVAVVVLKRAVPPVDDMRGGIVLQVALRGRHDSFADIWCVHPATHEERVITVWNERYDLPERGDEVWWWPGHSPGWLPAGWNGSRKRFLPRVGPSRPPVTGNL